MIHLDCAGNRGNPEIVTELKKIGQQNIAISYITALAVPDGFIAATAMDCDVELFTLNKRDFRFIDRLRLYV